MRTRVSAEDRLGTLSKEKSQLLKLLLEQKSREQGRIKRAARNHAGGAVRLPTSWAQQRLWFIDQLEGRSEVYHIAPVFRLKGILEPMALRNALDALVQRHESLRTVFDNVDGDPQQRIAPHVSFALALTDLTNHAEADREEQVRLHKTEEIRTRFDLSAGPLIRGRLLKVAPDEHVLLITMHHIISDGWSIGVLMREIGQLYSAALAGHENPLPPLPIQYGDYAVWQRNWLHQAAREKQLQYWRERLQGATAQLELPTDRPRPAVQSFRGENLQVILDAPLTAALRTLAQQHDSTLFMTLYAGWSILLSRLSGAADVVVGTPVANRQQPELEGLIGFFVNTLALRLNVREEFTIEQLLKLVKEVTLSAYQHQDVPFEQVVEALQPERSLSRNPIFQVMFALQTAPRGTLELPGASAVEEIELYESSMFDLMLSLEDHGERIVGMLNYSSDLFDRQTIERWIASFNVLLTGMVQNVSAVIGDLPILTHAERQRVVETFNATYAEPSDPGIIHQLFEQQAEHTPGAVAVEHEGRTLTYADLNSRANRLAHHLRSRGVRADQPVAICMPRQPEMVIGLLGILKAGGTYLPLDPNYPQERLQQMLDDAAAPLLLTHPDLEKRLPVSTAEVLLLDTESAEIAACPSDNDAAIDPKSTPDDLLYVIYTSGSTGRPKATAMPHRAMANLIEWHRRSLPYVAGRRTLQFAALSFDVAFQETFTTLCTGGTLVLIDEWVRRDARALTEFLSEREIERLFIPPLMLQSVAEHCQATGTVPAKLRDVICAGEQLRITSEIISFFQRRPECRLHNHYGPTETHVVTALTLHGEPSEWPALPSIGKPIANTQIYILDACGNPVPGAVAGEIYIGGAGVARGYLRRPDLTATRFVRDSFSKRTGATLYRTGDIGAWQADGSIKYLRRDDDQVKIRGFRIELGEIEAQLARHDAVREAVVVAREDAPGEKRLVAYVTQRGEVAPSLEDLRAHVKASLPDHMVPSAFVTLETLPLTPSGKLDRRALPAPQLDAYVRRTYEAPQGQLEEIVAGVWRNLLRLQRVGRQDNFFELGGHSLLMVQMLEHLRRAGWWATVRSVYESPNLSALARALTPEAAVQFEVPANRIPELCTEILPAMLPMVALDAEQILRISRAVPGGAANIQDIYPLTPLQEGMLFHHLLDQQGGDTYVLPMLLSLSSRQRVDDFIAALQRVINRHDVLRTAVLWEHLPTPVQVVQRSVVIPITEPPLDRNRDVLDQIKQRMELRQQRLDLRHAPLLRLQVAEDPMRGQWYALLQLHHMICDHESLGTMLAETMAYLDDNAPELPAAVPYRNHVAQVLAHAKAHDAEAFFRGKLQEIDEPTAPFGLTDVRGDGSQTEEIRRTFDPALSRRVRIQARAMAVSAATLFHAAWALIVARTSGRDDVVFGTMLLGRLQGSAGAQRILGMFMNALPLRVRIRDLTTKALVEQTQRELVELLNHEQASLAVAQRCSSIVGSAPLFSALLNYRWSNVDFAAEFSGEGLALESFQSWTNYPLVLSVDDQGESFVLEVGADRRIDPERIVGYLHAAMESLLDAIETAPDIQASSLSILPRHERLSVLEHFNATRTPWPREQLLHRLFEEQAECTPDMVAVVYGDRSLNYEQLDRRANQLARHLQGMGIGPGKLVALCVERSLEMVVGLLGILKAGAAYIPLDPSYPTERLQQMLEDAAPAALLTQQRLLLSLPSTPAHVVTLDSDWSAIAAREDGTLDREQGSQTSGQVAYVIYTSGSTGKPKGVMVQHANVVTFLGSMRVQPGMEADDCVLAVTTMSFDIAALEIFLPLTCGAKLILASREAAADARQLAAILEQFNVTVMQATPATWQMLLAAGWNGRASLKALCGGEALTTHLSENLLTRVGALWNMYGPTETTIWSCCKQIIAADTASPVESIGAPIANTQLYVLDRRLEPVPIGVTGEIYIGGDGVATGYLHRPELTAERFVPDPFSLHPQARMYRTGDVGQWRADGTIEFLGRNDHQVKIRGFRIEFGEIEARLLSHPRVKQAVVIAKERAVGDKLLVAYLTQSDTAPLGTEELRAHLKKALPEFMVPNAFVTLERLPTTPNGKLDRRALPDPEPGAARDREYEAPRGEVEQALAAIWQELLRSKQIGRYDDFFEMGGHSLIGMKLIIALAEQFDVQLPVGTVFRHPTIEQLAAAVTTAQANRAAEPVDLEGGVI